MSQNSGENNLLKENKEPPGTSENNNRRRWKEWHEREQPASILGKITKKGVNVVVCSQQLNTDLTLEYPNGVWQRFPKENKIKLLDNIAYIFTAHLPFLLKGNIRLEYNTQYPHSYLWANQSFMRHLPAYWYLLNARRGTHVSPMLKTLLNSRSVFAPTQNVIPRFPLTIDEQVIIPFTFGKDSFLTYHVAKDIGLKPILIWFHDPMDAGYEGKHKKILFKKFSKLINDDTFYIDNPLGSFREKGQGWFGWELAITSWVLLSLPFAYRYKAGYIIVSNEKSANAFFYDTNGIRVIPDYEQSAQATEELSLLSQSLSEGEVYTTTFLQGLQELAIIAILKQRYSEVTFPYLMSCWSETEAGRNKRWCGNCSKCARIYVFLVAWGIDPIKTVGFKDNMFAGKKRHLFNVFGDRASGTGWDAFGLNTDEQAFAFYLSYLRGNTDPLVAKFKTTKYFADIEKNLGKYFKEYLTLHEEHLTPKKWRREINKIFSNELGKARKEIRLLKVKK